MGWLLDRMVLRNSRHPLPINELERTWLNVDGNPIELFQLRKGDGGIRKTPLHVVKFIGAAGRAENVSLHPFDIWDHCHGTMTAANPSGFGQSPGRPRLDQLINQATGTVDYVRQNANQASILLSGSSLGGAVAICTAVRQMENGHTPVGIIVRDAPQLQQVIVSRFGPATGWWPAQLVSRNVPQSLDVVAAAERCLVPAVIVTSLRDRIVPPAAQRIWIERYAGPKRVVELPHAGHYDPMGPDGTVQYQDALQWLKNQLPS